MKSYTDLPFLDNLLLPTVQYSRAQALRAPLALAINTARTMPDEAMNDIVIMLEGTLDHIYSKVKQDEEVSSTVDADDVLGSLLGSSEAVDNPS